jgi:hypothetical protein
MVIFVTANVVFAYSVNKTNSLRGKQTAGEAVAKHINEKIEKGGSINSLNDPFFDQAGGTFNPRQLQFGLKLRF